MPSDGDMIMHLYHAFDPLILNSHKEWPFVLSLLLVSSTCLPLLILPLPFPAKIPKKKMSSLLWEDPREEPGSNLRRRRRRPGNVYIGTVKPTNRGQQPHHKKVGGTRTWLRVDCTGGSELVDMGKQSIMRMTGLLARDLRILDPMLSYPSSVTGREGAIVVNLENVKGIITANNFWLLNPKDPAVLPFVAELKKRARDHYEANHTKVRDYK